MSASRTVLGRLFHSLGAKYEKDLLLFVDLDILGIINKPEFCDRNERDGI